MYKVRSGSGGPERSEKYNAIKHSAISKQAKSERADLVIDHVANLPLHRQHEEDDEVDQQDRPARRRKQHTESAKARSVSWCRQQK